MNQISSEILTKTKIFHTTCFALSKIPQETILIKAQEAYDKVVN
jgi:fructokinase